MPRKPRLHIPHGVYHVMLRGNDRQRIFFDADDHRCLEELFTGGLARYACRIHAYCWMPNHIHLAIQIEDRPLGALMQWVAAQYARVFNRRYRRSGHLFERRHRAIWVDADRYLLALVRYIHHNPVRAGIASG